MNILIFFCYLSYNMSVETYIVPLESGLAEAESVSLVKGASNYLPRVYTAVSDNATQTTFRIDIGDEQLLLSRMLLLECPVRLYKVANDPGAAVAAPVNPASAVFPRQFAGMRGVRSISVNLNGVSLQSYPSRDLCQIFRYNNSYDISHLMREYLGAPDIGSIIDDTIRSYSDYQGNIVNSGFFGSRNLSTDYTEATSTLTEYDAELGLSASTVAGRVYRRDYMFRCPVWCPQLLDFFATGKNRTLPHVNTLEITLNWESDLVNHMFQGLNTAAATLYVNRAGAKPNGVAWSDIANGGICRLYASSYRAPYRVSPNIAIESCNLISDLTPVAQGIGATTTVTAVTSNRVVLSVVPEYVLICLTKRATQLRNVCQPDTFARIDSLTVEFGGQQVQFDKYALNRLRLESMLNGYKAIHQYIDRSGDVLMLRVGEQLPIPDTMYVGQSGQALVMYSTVSFSGPNLGNQVSNAGVLAAQVTEYYDISTLAVSPATIMLTPGSCVYKIGLPDSSLVVNNDVKLLESDMNQGHIEGSGMFFNKLKKFGNKVIHHINRGADIINQGSAKVDSILNDAQRANQMVQGAMNQVRGVVPKGGTIMAGTMLGGGF